MYRIHQPRNQNIILLVCSKFWYEPHGYIPRDLINSSMHNPKKEQIWFFFLVWKSFCISLLEVSLQYYRKRQLVCLMRVQQTTLIKINGWKKYSWMRHIVAHFRWICDAMEECTKINETIRNEKKYKRLNRSNIFFGYVTTHLFQIGKKVCPS